MENVIAKTLKLKEDLTLVAIEEQATLLDVDTRRYFDPNDTALFLLKLMEGGCRYEDIKAALVTEFAVAEETARVDVEDFVGELLNLGLVDSREATAHEIVRESTGERRPYQAPRLEGQADIALVTGALAAPTER
jgi:hypothetical protein